MSSKNLKKRSNTETVDQSPPKKQKKQIAIKVETNNPELNGDGVKAEQLTAKQRKRLTSKNRKLAAIAKIKEEGGVPKPLWPSKKGKKPKKEDEDTEKSSQELVSKKKLTVNRSVEDKLKAKQEKRAEVKQLRKEKRQEVGQYKPGQVNLTADEIRLRITEIKGRGELTKTARRKLGVLIKKLAIEEGTAVANNNENKTANNGDGDDDKSGLSKTVKRRIRRDKQESIIGVKKEDEDDDQNEEKPVDIQMFEKKKKQKQVIKQELTTETKKFGGNVKGNKKNKGKVELGLSSKSNDNKFVKEKIKEKEEEEEEEEEEDEESEDENEAVEPEEEEEDSEDDEEENEEQNSSDEEEDDDDEDSDNAKPDIVEKVVKKDEKKVKIKKDQVQGVKPKIDQEQNSDKKKRYILFVGNLPFDSKPEDVKAHFLTKVEKVSSVRIPTKPGTQTPRGFGYVEVLNDVDYEKGLSLHHTFLGGRRINVEYTLSGSKDVGKRKELVSKNQKLHAMRKAGKLAGSEKHDQKRSVRRFKKREQERESK